jgi:hypothetical protein
LSATAHHVDISKERLVLGEAGTRVARGAGAVGVLGLVASGFLAGGDPETQARFLLSYLVSYCFFLSIVLGGLFFVMIQHVTRAGWSVAVRRLAEGFMANAWLMAVLFLPILLGLDRLFLWARPEVVAEDPLLQVKQPYLNATFFVVRMAVCFGSWILLGGWLFRKSVQQDETRDPGATIAMQKVSAAGLFVFAITVTFCAFDLLMSLEPHWFSTIFGVYYFSGSVLVAFGALALASHLMQRSGRLTGVISIEHYHDLGKLMFAFVVFWSYIAFSQYMLIWYANIPEETQWFLRRQNGQWTTLSWFMLIGHFLVPFLALISRVPKRRTGPLIAAAVWILFVHWVDMYYLVMPHASAGVVPFHILDLTCFVGMGGLFVAAFAARFRRRSLLAHGDPRLSESLAFENY